MIPFVADFVHLIATSIWVGGLAMMAFVVPRVAQTLNDEDRSWLWLRTVVNFSTVAAVAVGVLIITGSYLSFLHVGSWTALIGTAYGRTLLLKLALAGVAMLMGGVQLDRDQAAARSGHRSTGVGAAVATAFSPHGVDRSGGRPAGVGGGGSVDGAAALERSAARRWRPDRCN